MPPPVKAVESYFEAHGGRVRLGVEPSLVPFLWSDYLRISSVSQREGRNLLDDAQVMGATPEDWRVSFVPILRMDFVAIEAWNGYSWIRTE
jgi:hypothetical protein